MNFKNHLILSNNKELISKNYKNVKIGNWIDSPDLINFNSFKYHWSNKKKLELDLKYIKKVYQFYIRIFLVILTNILMIIILIEIGKF